MRGKRLKAAMVVAMASAALLATGAGFAQMHRHQGRHQPGEGFGPGFLMGRMVERLDLSEGQQQQIQDFMQAHRDVMDPLMDQLRDARQEVAQRIHAPVLDEAAIREAAAAIGPLEADIAVERGRALQAIREVLTPEQQAELDEMMADMHDELGPGSGPGPGPHHRQRRAVQEDGSGR